MKILDIGALKRWAADLLSPAGDVGGPFVMTNYSAKELGKDLLDLIQDRQGLLNMASELRKERDSFSRALRDSNTECLAQAECVESLLKERDSLERDLKAAVCARDHNRECIGRLVEERTALRQERDSLRSHVECLAKAGVVLKEERDSLKRKVGRLKDLIAAFPDDVVGGGVA